MDSGICGLPRLRSPLIHQRSKNSGTETETEAEFGSLPQFVGKQPWGKNPYQCVKNPQPLAHSSPFPSTSAFPFCCCPFDISQLIKISCACIDEMQFELSKIKSNSISISISCFMYSNAICVISFVVVVDVVPIGIGIGLL